MKILHFRSHECFDELDKKEIMDSELVTYEIPELISLTNNKYIYVVKSLYSKNGITISFDEYIELVILLINNRLNPEDSFGI